MIVCHCAGVTDKQIQKAMELQSVSWSQAVRMLRVGRDCGGCSANIKEGSESWAPVTPGAQPQYYPA